MTERAQLDDAADPITDQAMINLPPLPPQITTPNPALWANIPEEMKARPQWMFATLQPKPDGKPDKAPRNARNGWVSDSTSFDNWATFEEAAHAAWREGGLPGFCLTATDPFAILDLDPRDSRGGLRPLERRQFFESVLNMHHDDYRERSRSGEGAHIVYASRRLGGTIGFPARQSKGLDLFSQDRFVLMTGDVELYGGPQNPGVEEDVNDILNRLPSPITGDNLPDPGLARWTTSEVFDRMLASKRIFENDPEPRGQKLKRWFYSGPTSGEDWSSCDHSFLKSALIYSEGQHEQALELFRASKLYRLCTKGKGPKHYEEYYLLGQTLPKAVASYRAWVDRNKAMTLHGAALIESLRPRPAGTAPVITERSPGEVWDWS